MRFALIVSLLFSLSGCAVAPAAVAFAPAWSSAANTNASPELMRAKTAEYFGVSQRSVRISQYDKGILATSFKARVSGTLYNCQYYYGSVRCARPGEGTL